MQYVVTFHNTATNRTEACLYPNRKAAEDAAKTEWFSVYECTIAPVVNI